MKRYPFNMNKYQHDIFFRYNRARNEMDEKFLEGTLSTEELDKYERLIEGLENLLNYGIGIVWLTGREFGLAKETVLWADTVRHGG